MKQLAAAGISVAQAGGGGVGGGLGGGPESRVAEQKERALDLLWLNSIRLEARAKGAGIGDKLVFSAPALTCSASLANASSPALAAARALMAKALQARPASGALWAESIALAEKATKTRACRDGIKAASESSQLVCMVAMLFAVNRKHNKAERWFEKALALSADRDGDALACYLAYALQERPGGDAKRSELAAAIEKRCAAVASAASAGAGTGGEGVGGGGSGGGGGGIAAGEGSGSASSSGSGGDGDGDSASGAGADGFVGELWSSLRRSSPRLRRVGAVDLLRLAASRISIKDMTKTLPDVGV